MVHHLLSPRRLTPVLFNFEIQVRQVRQQAKQQTPQHAYRRPLGRGDPVQQLQQPVSRSPADVVYDTLL